MNIAIAFICAIISCLLLYGAFLVMIWGRILWYSIGEVIDQTKQLQSHCFCLVGDVVCIEGLDWTQLI